MQQHNIVILKNVNPIYTDTAREIVSLTILLTLQDKLRQEISADDDDKKDVSTAFCNCDVKAWALPSISDSI